MVRDIEEMIYNKPEWDENGDRQVGIATLMRYRTPDGHEGLCTTNRRCYYRASLLGCAAY